MFSNLEKKLKEIKPNSMTHLEKTGLWHKIEKNIECTPSSFFNWNQKFALASFLVFAIVAGSAATIAASNSAKPGDLLFPVDTAIEKVQVLFAGETRKQELKTKFAEERFQETKKILTMARLDSATSTQNLPKNFKTKKIDNAQEALEITLKYLEELPSASTVDKIINQLTELAENHVSDLDDFEAKIKNNGNHLKVEIKTSSDKLKVKFNLKREKHDEDENDNDDDEDEHEDENDAKVIVCHMPPGNTRNGRTIEISKEAMQTHLNHGDALGKCGTATPTPTPTSTADIIAPTLSNIHSDPATTTANVIWTTNELATSEIWYGTTTPLIILQATWFASSTNLVANHNLSLTGLNASTTYYFIVGSKDSTGNPATSSESSFLTLP